MMKLGTGLVLLAATGLLASAPANAADLGGNCCADLEERIAELEATTARKGNRKVKLEVSGHVNEMVLYWDDGVEDNVGVYTNDNARTRVRFKGSAKVTDDIKAGYLIEIGIRSANSKRFNQDDPDAADESGLDLRHATWFLESKTLGKIWVGRTGPAAEGITEINLAHTKDVAKFSDVEDTGLGLGIRFANGNLGIRNSDGDLFSWRRLIAHSGDQPGETERGNIVRYDTPEFAGFMATAAWGGDDYWDVGLRYSGEMAGFKIAGGIAYGEETNVSSEGNIIDDCLAVNNVGGGTSDVSCEQVGGSLSIMHEATGLYVTGGAGWRKDNNITLPGVFDGGDIARDDSTFYAIEPGIEQKWLPFGKTTLFGQYYHTDGGSNDRTDLSFDNNVTRYAILGTELDMYGGGIVQSIDAASMLLYVYYRHYEGEVDLVNSSGAHVATPGIDDLDIVVGGGMIKF